MNLERVKEADRDDSFEGIWLVKHVSSAAPIAQSTIHHRHTIPLASAETRHSHCDQFPNRRRKPRMNLLFLLQFPVLCREACRRPALRRCPRSHYSEACISSDWDQAVSRCKEESKMRADPCL